MKLSALEPDQPFKGYLYIRDAAVRTSKTGSQFIKLQLSDQDYSQVTAFLWNVSPEDVKLFRQGNLVGVMGRGKNFNDTLQLDIQRIRLANEGDNVDISDFIETAPEASEDMYAEILEPIEGFKNEDIKIELLNKLYPEINKDRF